MTKKETVQNRDGQGLGTAASAAAGIDQLTSWPAINRTKAKVRKRLLIIAFKRAKGNGSVCGISRLLPVQKRLSGVFKGRRWLWKAVGAGAGQSKWRTKPTMLPGMPLARQCLLILFKRGEGDTDG